MIRHMVHLRFTDTVSMIARAEMLAALDGLRAHLAGILDYRMFRNISPETPVLHGFMDLFWFDFVDESARDIYLADPAHQAIGARLVAAVGGLDGILVCDIAM